MTKYTLLILFSLALLSTGCFQDRKSEVTEVPESQFTIHVYRIKDEYPETADYIINDEDIVQYDWSQQILVLDPKLKQLYETDNNFLRFLSKFTATLDNEPIFQGEFVESISARRLLSPLIYAYVLEEDMFLGYEEVFPEYANGDDYLRIHFRTQSIISRNNSNPLIFPVDAPLVQEQIRQHFINLNKLVE